MHKLIKANFELYSKPNSMYKPASVHYFVLHYKLPFPASNKHAMPLYAASFF